MSIWGEIRNDFIDDDGIAHIDAYLTDDDMEEGKVIAEIEADGEVIYKDDRAKTDAYAQEIIQEAHFQMLLDRVITGIKSDFEMGDVTAVEELIGELPIKNLIGYLPEEIWKNFETIK
jgi:hypothetical protein